MKVCGYCGQQNDEAASLCSECGTSLVVQKPLSLREIANWPASSPWGLALTSGLAALFITTGLYLAVGRACLDIITASRGEPVPPHNGAIYRYLILMPPSLGVCLGIGLTIMALAICYRGCLRRSQAIAVGVLAVGIAAFMKLVPGVWWFALPAVLFGAATNSSVAFYIGAAFQLAMGAWLLGFFGQRRNEEKATA